MAISLDATAVGQAAPNSTGYNGSITTSITTSVANSILVVMVSNEYPAQTPSSVSGVTAGGPTFVQRSQYKNTGMANGGSQNIEFWWAVAPNVTTYSVVTTFAGGYVDDAAVIVFAVSGCNTTNPWDTDASFPAKLAYNTISATVSTNATNTMIISYYATPGTNGSTVMRPISPVGLNNTGSVYVDNTGAQWFQLAYSAYGISATKQTNATWGWSSVTGGITSGSYSTTNPSYYVVIDALVSATQPVVTNGNFLQFC